MGRKRAAEEDAVSSSKKARFEPDEGFSPREENITSTSPESLTSTAPESAATTSLTSTTSHKRPKIYFCNYDDCDKVFDRPVRLAAHLRTHTDERPFICSEPDCDKRFFKVEHLKAHVQIKHSTVADFVCEYVLRTNEDGEKVLCGKAFATSSRLKRHLAIHEQKEDLKCHELGCGQVFRKMDTLQRHIKKDHLQQPSYRCCTKPLVSASSDEEVAGEQDECGEVFSELHQLRTHELKVHLGSRYFCEHCIDPTSATGEMLGFQTYNLYQAHLKTVHPPRCPECDTVCASSRALTAHMEIEHSNLDSRKQNFVCEYEGCGRGFTKRGNLNVHIQNVHLSIKKFACGETDLSDQSKCPGWSNDMGCGMKYGTKGSLITHIRKHHLQLDPVGRASKLKKAKTAADADAASPGANIHLSHVEDQNTISLLTGHGYNDMRHLACWDGSCAHRFVRECDLAQHMELYHGWNVDDINDRLAENAVLNGSDDKFWLGGIEANDNDMLVNDFAQGMDDMLFSQNFDGFDAGEHVIHWGQEVIDPMLVCM